MAEVIQFAKASVVTPPVIPTRATPSQLADIDFEAAMTMEDIRVFEDSERDHWGIGRRVTLVTLTRSRDELVEALVGLGESDGMNFIGGVDGYLEHAMECVRIAETVRARLVSAVGTAEHRGLI